MTDIRVILLNIFVSIIQKILQALLETEKESTDTNITSDQFLQYFKQLADADNDSIDSSDVFDEVQNAVYEELGVTNKEEEISKAIGRLKSNKNSSEDIINEMSMKCRDVMTPLLCRLCNEIYNSCFFFPESWSEGCIVPIYKKVTKTTLTITGE